MWKKIIEERQKRKLEKMKLKPFKGNIKLCSVESYGVTVKVDNYDELTGINLRDHVEFMTERKLELANFGVFKDYTIIYFRNKE